MTFNEEACKYKVIDINAVFQIIFETNNEFIPYSGTYWLVENEGTLFKEGYVEDALALYQLHETLVTITYALHTLDRVSSDLVGTLETRDIFTVDDITDFLSPISDAPVEISYEDFISKVY